MLTLSGVIMSNAINMTNEQRAKKAAEERWHPTIPRATHSGILIIAGKEIACDVLENGQRVLRQSTLLKSVGRSNLGSKERRRAEDVNLPVFLIANNLMPYLKQEIIEKGSPIIYRGVDGRRISGYDAAFLPEICKIYVQAEHDGVFKESPQQLRIAAICKIMLYGLAAVGITALIDDCTGYVHVREKTELQKILQAYISEELREWTKKFPDEFFKQIYRLHNWEYPKLSKNHPQYIGKIINKYVYDRLPLGVLEELKKINPINEKGIRSHRHHQFLSDDIGEENLNKQILIVTSMMKASRNKDEFIELMERI